MRLRLHAALALLVLVNGLAISAHGYALLTHEELIDLTWDASIVPLLLSRYPTLTPAQLEQARAFAYGGCVIQDIGYYPLGDRNISNLTHYVRSGDFVVNLFRNAQNANELAFAVGALSHYIGDSVGHSEATNVAVPVEFPKLQKKYGNVVNYAEGEEQHVRTEFAFDIDEIAKHRIAPVNYLRHVGLEISTRQLALAFYETYGIHVDFSQTRHHRINVDDYRWAVHRFIPRVAYSTTLLHRKHEPPDVASDPDVQRLTQQTAAIEKENHWDDYRKRPGVLTYTVAGFLFIVPKFGPIRLAAVKGPTSQTELEYVHSVMRSTDSLNQVLRHFTPPSQTRPSTQQADDPDGQSLPPASDPLPVKHVLSDLLLNVSRDPHHPLLNRDLDTGIPVKPGGYPLTDQTYAYLLHQLTLKPAVPIPAGIKEDILAYYADLSVPFATKKDPAAWAVVQQDLATLQTMPVNPWQVPYPTYGDGTNDDIPAPTGQTPAAN